MALDGACMYHSFSPFQRLQTAYRTWLDSAAGCSCVAGALRHAWARAVTLQWDKMRRSGSVPHLARWFDFVCKDPLLVSVAERHGPKKPSSRTEYRKEVAAAGMGGGGAPILAHGFSLLWQQRSV